MNRLLLHLLSLVMVTSAWGIAIPKNGERVLPFELHNQYGEMVTISDARILLYLPDEEAWDILEMFMAKRDSAYLQKRGIRIVADISNAPAFVRSLFIRPGMREKNYEVLIIEDELSPVIFSSKLKHVSVVWLKNGKQRQSAFYKKPAALAAALHQ